MPELTTQDGTKFYYEDWGTAQPIVFSDAWPLSADAWDASDDLSSQPGLPCTAHDGQGQGRSSQPGNETNTYRARQAIHAFLKPFTSLRKEPL